MSHQSCSCWYQILVASDDSVFVVSDGSATLLRTPGPGTRLACAGQTAVYGAMTTLWTYPQDARLDVSLGTLLDMTVVGGAIVLKGSDGLFGTDGTDSWAISSGGTQLMGELHARAFVHDKLFFVQSSELAYVDTRSWSVQVAVADLANVLPEAPAVSGNLVFFTGSDRTIYAFNHVTGVSRAAKSFEGIFSSPVVSFRCNSAQMATWHLPVPTSLSKSQPSLTRGCTSLSRTTRRSDKNSGELMVGSRNHWRSSTITLRELCSLTSWVPCMWMCADS